MAGRGSLVTATRVPSPLRYRPWPAGLGLEQGPVGCSEVCLRDRYPVPLTATTLSPPPYSPWLPVCRHNAVHS